MITVTNLNFYPIRISLKAFEILPSVLQFILAKPPEESWTLTLEFFKTAFFKGYSINKRASNETFNLFFISFLNNFSTNFNFLFIINYN